MNAHISAQISNMLQIAKTFEQSCEMATLQDDRYRSKEEKKNLAKIKSATEKFRNDLEKIK